MKNFLIILVIIPVSSLRRMMHNLLPAAVKKEENSWILLLSQLDAEYLKNLITYKKILQQRNSLLRSFAETRNKDFSLLDVIDEQFINRENMFLTKEKNF